MDQRDFDELAGRIEGLARAVLILAQTVERETDMDGLTLTHQWRESVGPQPGGGSLDTARKTLHALAQQMDDARSRDQESLLQAMLADPTLAQAHLQLREPVRHKHLDTLGERLTLAERRIDQLGGTAPIRPPAPPAR